MQCFRLPDYMTDRSLVRNLLRPGVRESVTNVSLMAVLEADRTVWGEQGDNRFARILLRHLDLIGYYLNGPIPPNCATSSPWVETYMLVHLLGTNGRLCWLASDEPLPDTQALASNVEKLTARLKGVDADLKKAAFDLAQWTQQLTAFCLSLNDYCLRGNIEGYSAYLED